MLFRSARAGIPEVWLIDLSEERVEVYREPIPQGYRVIQQVRRGEHLTLAMFPDLNLAVDAILG